MILSVIFNFKKTGFKNRYHGQNIFGFQFWYSSCLAMLFYRFFIKINFRAIANSDYRAKYGEVKTRILLLLQIFYASFLTFLTRKSPIRCRSGWKLPPPAASLAVYWPLWRSHPSARPILHWSIRRSSGLPLRSGRRLSHPRKRRHLFTSFSRKIWVWMEYSVFWINSEVNIFTTPFHQIEPFSCVSNRGKAVNRLLIFQRLRRG